MIRRNPNDINELIEEESSTPPIEILSNSPLIKGKFIFQGIQEGNSEEKRNLIFNPPLMIDYIILEKIDRKTGKENYSENAPIMGFATFDFGMEVIVPLDVEHNWLVNGYGGLTKESSLEEILMQSIFFDLFHSFFHPIEDPNYSHYNFALKGWLKDRVTLK